MITLNPSQRSTLRPPKVTGRPPRAQTQPQDFRTPKLGSLPLIIFPGWQTLDISGPKFQIPQHLPSASGSQGRSSWEKPRQGKGLGRQAWHSARELGRPEPLVEAPTGHDAHELPAAAARPAPSSSARGAAALLASVRASYGAGREWAIPLPPACRLRNKQLKPKFARLARGRESSRISTEGHLLQQSTTNTSVQALPQ